MKLFVLFAQRTEEYQGQHAPECLAVMSEWDEDANPDYLRHEKAKADATGEFERTEVIPLDVSTEAVLRRLLPGVIAIPAVVA